MIEIFKTENGTLKQLDAVEPGCWVNVCSITDEDAAWLSANLDVSDDFLSAMSDRDEVSRADKDVKRKQALVIVDYPADDEKEELIDPEVAQFVTEPLSILLIEDPGVIVTASTAACGIITKLRGDADVRIVTSKRTRFLLDVLYEVSKSYIEALRTLEKHTVNLERKLRKRQKNTGLMNMLSIEKSLLYMSTSLKSCEPTLEAIQRGDFVDLFDGDKELFSLVIIEYKQAAEMCAIYTDVITKAMDAFSSVINNNMNAAMSVLTTITLVLSIPTAVFSFYGMNTNLLPLADSWIFPMLLSFALAAIATVLVLRFKR